MKTEGDSKRKLSERKDPGAHSVGCYIEQGFPADAIQYHLRGLANGRPAETPLDEALASASIPQFRWPVHPHASQDGSGPIQGRPGIGSGQSMHSGLPEGGPGTRSNSPHHPQVTNRQNNRPICTVAMTGAWLVRTARKRSLCGLGFGADQRGDSSVMAQLVQASAAVRPDAADRDA